MDNPAWNEQILSLPAPHILQSQEWGRVKAHYGWKPIYKTWENHLVDLHTRRVPKVRAASLILQRSFPLWRYAIGLQILYVPKGPLLDWSDVDLRGSVLDDLAILAKRAGAIFIKIDPDVVLGTGVPGTAEAQDDPLGMEVVADLRQRGWLFSDDQIQFRNTVLVDLSPSLDDLLLRMKQKTRYNIRLAERKGVAIRTGKPDELEMLYHMYAETSVRDGFAIRDAEYYLYTWRTFLENKLAEVLIAEVEGQPIAGAIIFHFGEKAWYLYGMSKETHREKMPNHLLQWSAMQYAKTTGCCWYDLWGAPDHFDESDPLWGVFRFKQGLGGEVVRHIGAWDLPVHPHLYSIYTRILPRLLSFMRRKGKERTQRLVVN